MAGQPPLNLQQEILKKLGIPTYVVIGIGLAALGFYAYKSILDSTKVKLEIKNLRRILGDVDGDDTRTERLSKKLERL